MKKRLGALLLALAMLAVSACDSESVSGAFGMKIYDTSHWIVSDMKESFDGVGEIKLSEDFAAAVNRDRVLAADKYGMKIGMIFSAVYGDEFRSMTFIGIIGKGITKGKICCRKDDRNRNTGPDFRMIPPVSSPSCRAADIRCCTRKVP